MKIKLNILFCSKALGFFLLLLMLSTRVYAQKSTTITESCLPKLSTEDATKTALLKQAKQQAIGQLFGETVSKVTASRKSLTHNNGEENFNSDVDTASSSSMIGKVHVQGTPTYGPKGFDKYCISARLYATDEDVKRYSTTLTPLPLSNDKKCGDNKTKAEQQSAIALLKNYALFLNSYSDQELLKLLHQIKQSGVPSDNLAHGGRYCVTVTAKIRPREIEMLRAKATHQAEAKVAKKKRQAQQPITNSIGMKFIPIRAGSFRMGDLQGGGYSDEKPVHAVNIKAFYISETEITQDQWQQVMGDNPSYYKSGNNYPVEKVSWNEVQAFIQELNDQTGKTYRLPSEAEWEYAARAGSTTKYSWGKYIARNRANYGKDEGFGGFAKGKDKWENTSPVASFKPNARGLYDMHGNVWEWTQDCWHSNYNNAPTDGSAWESGGSGNCAYRVLRGGSWSGNPLRLRSANRGWYDASDGDINFGFRLIQDP